MSALTCGTETGVGGEGARLMILLQFGLEREMSKKIFSSCISDYPALACIQNTTKTPPVNTDLGQAILWELPLQMRRQLQGHRTYLKYYCVNIWTSHQSSFSRILTFCQAAHS